MTARNKVATASTGLDALIKSLRQEIGEDGVSRRGLPPVEAWNPPFCGEAGFEILKDGVWVHEGTRITREPLARLFASILRKDADGETYLVTPAEKILVRVEDAPFLAIRADRVGEGTDQTIVFTTNMGDIVQLGPAHPLRVADDPKTREPRPYVLVRGRLEARILRAPFYELVEWAQERAGKLALQSQGAWFELGVAG